MIGASSPTRVFRVETVVWIVITVAGVGLLLGAVFGYVAGRIAPSFFQHMMAMPDNPIDVEPRGTATLLGATGGVILGGMLGGFSVLMNVASQWIAMRRETRS
jgi:NhaP-type Na+/H+ or K+/H+ antiporter